VSGRSRTLDGRSRRDVAREQRLRRRSLVGELALFGSASDRSDLEALLARYDDSMTAELHDILVHQEALARRQTDRPWRAVGGL
jgi:hypothetical protein